MGHARRESSAEVYKGVYGGGGRCLKKLIKLDGEKRPDLMTQCAHGRSAVDIPLPHFFHLTSYIFIHLHSSTTLSYVSRVRAQCLYVLCHGVRIDVLQVWRRQPPFTSDICTQSLLFCRVLSCILRLANAWHYILWSRTVHCIVLR